MRPLISVFLALTPVAFAQYVLEDDYTTGSFASNWNFFTADDPTNGYVNYVSEAEAVTSGLLSTLANGSVYLGVDNTNVATGRGRNSLRLESKKNYNHGLFILDLAHMPGGQCGSWPAYWLIGPGVPEDGEVDIIEAINTDTTNLMSVKTGRECSISQQVMTGTLETTDCNINTGGLVGCSIDSATSAAYGGGFNALNGGVYATEWTSDAVTIWYFPRSAIPADITAGVPNPALWGVPLSKFVTTCNLDENLVNQQVILNIDFCGDYAGDPFFWDNNPTCKALADTCNDYVQNNPTAFSQTYWLINQLRVYQQIAPTTTSTSSSVAPSTSTLSTTSSPSPSPSSLTSSSSSLSSTLTTSSPSPTIDTSSLTSTSSTTSPDSPTTTSSPSPTVDPSSLTTTSFTPTPIPLTTSSASSTVDPSSLTTTTASLSSSASEITTTSLTPSPSISSTTSQESISPIDGSTTSSTLLFTTTSTSSQQIGPIDGSTTSSASTDMPSSVTTTPITTTATTPATVGPIETTFSSSLISETTTSYDFTASTSGQMTFNPSSSQFTFGPIPGSSSTTSAVYISTSSTSSTLFPPDTTSLTTSSRQIDPNQGTTSTSTSTSSAQITSSSGIQSGLPLSTTKSTSSTTSAGAKGWSNVQGAVTTTLKATWVEPCSTGLTTKRTTLVTTHCGCTDEPVPTFSFVKLTTICPPDWPITTPYVITKPVPPPMPTSHTKIVTTDTTGKIITITRALFAPTQTVVVPVVVVPYAPGQPNIHGGQPGAPSGTLLTISGTVYTITGAAKPTGSVVTISGTAYTITGAPKPTGSVVTISGSVYTITGSVKPTGAPSSPSGNVYPGGDSDSDNVVYGDGGDQGSHDSSDYDSSSGGKSDASSSGLPASNDSWNVDGSGSAGYGNDGSGAGDNSGAGSPTGSTVAPDSYTGGASDVIAVGTTLVVSLAMVAFMFVELAIL